MSDASDLVAAVHEGAHEQPPWGTFLKRLRATTRSFTASFTFRPDDAGQTCWVEASAAIGPAVEEVDFAVKDAPVRSFFLHGGREFGHVYSLEELRREIRPAEEAMLREALDEKGISSMRVMGVKEPHGRSAWLGIMRENADFAPADDHLLTDIEPHLKHAFRSFAALERERLRTYTAEVALDRLNIQRIALDCSGKIIDIDDQLAATLQASDALGRDQFGRLTFRSRDVNREFRQIIDSYAAGIDRTPSVLRVSHEPKLDIILTAARGRGGEDRMPLAFIAFLVRGREISLGRIDQVAATYGLLPSEARMAVALSRGMTIAEAADHCGITLLTARDYSKRIYSKMNVSGLPALMHKMLTGPIILC